MKTLQQYKEESEQLAEEINQISELVLGYREGKFVDIFVKIAGIKTTAFKHIKNKHVEELYEFIDDLAEMKEYITSQHSLTKEE